MLGIRNGLAQFKKTSKLKRKRNEKKKKKKEMEAPQLKHGWKTQNNLVRTLFHN